MNHPLRVEAEKKLAKAMLINQKRAAKILKTMATEIKENRVFLYPEPYSVIERN